MADEEFKPCPFCGETKVKFVKFTGHVRYICGHCNAFGPPAYGQGSARGVWNRRIVKEGE